MGSGNIHPTALIDPKAELDTSVQVGPYAVIGPDVQIGARTQVGAHSVIQGVTSIGQDNHIHCHVSLGGAPQDKKYAGEPTRLIIGDRNTIREFCTFNTGTAQDEGITRVGHDNWIMAYVHIAHDCVVGDHTILANNATLAGHVHLGDWAILGGLTGVHQFVKIGSHVMAGFASRIAQDVPPFMMIEGNPLSVRGFNAEGLRRRGFTPERLRGIKQIYKRLYRQGLTVQAARDEIALLPTEIPESHVDVAMMLEFLEGATRGIVR